MRIMSAVAAVVVLAAVTLVVVAYVRGHQDKGYAPSSAAVPARCQLSTRTLSRAHTTNPWHFRDAGTTVECYWRQTQGRDGVDTRSLGYTITRHDSVPAAHTEFRQAASGFTPVPGLGDEAGYMSAPYPGGMTDARLVARRDTLVVDVGYLGQDQDFLGTSPMPDAEGRAVTTMVARELLAQ